MTCRGWVAGRRGHLDPHRKDVTTELAGDGVTHGSAACGPPTSGPHARAAGRHPAGLRRAHKTGDRYDRQRGPGPLDLRGPHRLRDQRVPPPARRRRRAPGADRVTGGASPDGRPARPRSASRRRRPGHRTAAALGQRQPGDVGVRGRRAAPDPPAGAAIRGAPHRHGRRGGAVAGGPGGGRAGAAGGGDRRTMPDGGLGDSWMVVEHVPGETIARGSCATPSTPRPGPAGRAVRRGAGPHPPHPGRHPRPGRRRPGGPGGRRSTVWGSPTRLRAGVPVAGAVPAGGRHARSPGSSTATSGSA